MERKVSDDEEASESDDIPMHKIMKYQIAKSQHKKKIKKTFSLLDSENKLRTDISYHNLLKVANILKVVTNIKLERETKRKYESLKEWFEVNLDQIRPYLKTIECLDTNMETIYKLGDQPTYLDQID